jgi:hypothetical protein
MIFLQGLVKIKIILKVNNTNICTLKIQKNRFNLKRF